MEVKIKILSGLVGDGCSLGNSAVDNLRGTIGRERLGPGGDLES